VAPVRRDARQGAARAAAILYGRPSIRAGAIRDGVTPLLKPTARLLGDAIKR
jgi:hypothetical protein